MKRLILKEVYDEALIESQMQELGWKDIKHGAKKFATGAALAGAMGAATPAFAGDNYGSGGGSCSSTSCNAQISDDAIEVKAKGPKQAFEELEGGGVKINKDSMKRFVGEPDVFLKMSKNYKNDRKPKSNAVTFEDSEKNIYVMYITNDNFIKMLQMPKSIKANW